MPAIVFACVGDIISVNVMKLDSYPALSCILGMAQAAIVIATNYVMMTILSLAHC